MDTTHNEEHGVSVELEALQAIYIHELEVFYYPQTNVPRVVSINLHPSTADNTSEQFVRLTLTIVIPANYPNEIPEITIRSPRGLSDSAIERINNDLREHADRSKGSPMLFELIEIAKEHLTLGNTPSCVCTICLYGFSNEDVFTKTECYHYFHSHCLYRFIEASLKEEIVVQPSFKEAAPENKVLCPVCREPFTYDLEALKAPPPIQSEKAPSFIVDEKLTELQQQMAKLFSDQKCRGGIIDLEEEKKKFLIEISSVQSNVDIDLHVDRPGFDNNVTGVKKKNNKSKKKTKVNTQVNNSGISDKGPSSSRSEVKICEEVVNKTQKNAAVIEKVVSSNSDHKDGGATNHLCEGNHKNVNVERRRRNNKPRTSNQAKYIHNPNKIGTSQNGPKSFPGKQHYYYGASSSTQQIGDNERERKTYPENGHAIGKPEGGFGNQINCFNGMNPRKSGNSGIGNAQDKLPKVSSNCERDSLETKSKSDYCVKEVNCSSNWVYQPMVVTGPPKMAFGGALATSMQTKFGLVRPPPGFETKTSNGTGYVANILPPARFQASRPPPGFNGSTTSK